MKKILFPMLVLLGFACSAPKNYYMFKQPHFEYDKPEKAVVVAQDVDEVEAPVEEVEQAVIPEPVRTQLAEESPVILSKQQLDNQVAVAETATSEPFVFNKDEYKAMSKAEKKVARKMLKKELKNYIKETKAIAKGEKVERTSEFQVTGYTRIGLILAAAGIVLMILTTGTVSQLGSLLVLVGVIFVLIDLL